MKNTIYLALIIACLTGLQPFKTDAKCPASAVPCKNDPKDTQGGKCPACDATTVTWISGSCSGNILSCSQQCDLILVDKTTKIITYFPVFDADLKCLDCEMAHVSDTHAGRYDTTMTPCQNHDGCPE